MPRYLTLMVATDSRIVLYFRLFPNMGDKTHPFTVYDTFMQKVRVETEIEIKNNKIGYD